MKGPKKNKDLGKKIKELGRMRCFKIRAILFFHVIFGKNFDVKCLKICWTMMLIREIGVTSIFFCKLRVFFIWKGKINAQCR